MTICWTAKTAATRKSIMTAFVVSFACNEHVIQMVARRLRGMDVAQNLTRKQAIVALLASRPGERMTATEISVILKTDVENVRAALKRLYARGEIRQDRVVRQYKVCNSVARHMALLWWVS